MLRSLPRPSNVVCMHLPFVKAAAARVLVSQMLFADVCHHKKTSSQQPLHVRSLVACDCRLMYTGIVAAQNWPGCQAAVDAHSFSLRSVCMMPGLHRAELHALSHRILKQGYKRSIFETSTNIVWHAFCQLWSKAICSFLLWGYAGLAEAHKRVSRQEQNTVIRNAGQALFTNLQAASTETASFHERSCVTGSKFPISFV